MCDQEIPLLGGNINASVVRSGNTVRRITGPNSKTIHRLLLHLADMEFSYSPRFLGLDDKGREILSFIDGRTEWPQKLWQDDKPLKTSASILRQYHDATLGFTHQNDDSWAFRYSDRNRHEVICHVDFAPYNMIFDETAPIGIIDWDLAGPGPRLWDLAYLAYWLVPLSFSSHDMSNHSNYDVAQGSKRLKLLGKTYGTSEYAALLDMVQEVLDHMSDEENTRRMIGSTAAQNLKEGGHFDHWRREATGFSANRAQIWQNFGASPP